MPFFISYLPAFTFAGNQLYWQQYQKCGTADDIIFFKRIFYILVSAASFYKQVIIFAFKRGGRTKKFPACECCRYNDD